MHVCTLPLKFLYRPDALSPNQQRQSIEGNHDSLYTVEST